MLRPQVLGIDGYTEAVYNPTASDCCADPLCVPVEQRICAFIDLLPSGPMWDYPKAQIRAWAAGQLETIPCPSMVSYAAYLAVVMQDMVDNILIPALDASDPRYLRPENIEKWLDLLGWQDCYRTFCRSEFMAETSPFECLGPCGYEYTAPIQTDRSVAALQYAIVLSLLRMNRGGVKNLAWINWVIAPLATEIYPLEPYPDPPDPDNCYCDTAELVLCPTGDNLKYPTGSCAEAETATAWAEFHCEGQEPKLIHTGTAAAQCIVNSILRRNCPNMLVRCEAAEKEESA